jgi:hypothetical protein
MRKRSILLALAAGLLACSFGNITSMAGTVDVYQDAGTFSFSLTSTGSGHFSISYSNALLTTINNDAIPTGSIEALLPTSAPHTVTSTVTTGAFTSYTLSQPAPNLKSFGVGPGAILTATLEYELTTGTAINPGFLNLSGTINSVSSALLETTATSPTIYDFSAYSLGADITRTYTSVGSNFANVIAHGGTIIGTGAFADLATIPEPSSMALLGIGVSCLFVGRRHFKWSSVA